MNLDDFDLDLTEDDTLVNQSLLDDYVTRKIANIAHDPLGSKWRIANYQTPS